MVLQHLSKSVKFLTDNKFEITSYFKFVGILGGRIFGRQKDVVRFKESSFSHQTCCKIPVFRKLSFVVFIWFSKGLSLFKGVPEFRDTC